MSWAKSRESHAVNFDGQVVLGLMLWAELASRLRCEVMEYLKMTALGGVQVGQLPCRVEMVA